MIKGLITTLFAAAITFAGIGISHASAPVLQDLPDVTIGEVEDNSGTDNNYLVFTNAFRFDDYVSDAETTDKSQLKWSFDEGDPVSPDANARWFAVNGKLALHAGSVEMATDGSAAAAHAAPPGANELRSVSDYASFRDVIFTPLAGSAPFPGPANQAEEDNHTAGKVVRFFVSDDVNVVSNDILVKSVADDVTPDSISAPYDYQEIYDELFATAANWSQMSLFGSGVSIAYNGASAGLSPDAAGELRVTFPAGSGYRFGGWWSRDGSGNSTATSLDWSEVGANNYVRGKYFLYAGGQTNPADVKQNPSFRLRITQRQAVAQFLEVTPNSPDGEAPPAGGVDAYAQDMRVSEEAGRPSLYRVDMDPIDVPAAQTRHVDLGFEVFNSGTTGGGAEANGFLALTEAEIGIYPKSILPETSPVKSYLASANDFTGAVAAGATSLSRWFRDAGGGFTGVQDGATVFANSTTGITVSNSTSTGLTVDMTTLEDTRIGIATSTVTNGNAADQGNLTGRIRIGADQLYKVKFHVTSTVAAANQSIMILRVRALKFQYNNALQLGPSTAGGSVGAIASEAAPGTGNQLPAADRKPGDTTGGWYTVMFHSPMSKQIRPETAYAGQTVAQRQPGIAALDDEGENTGSTYRRRDIILETQAYSGYLTASNNDTLRYSIDEVQIYRYAAVPDGHENYGN